jgi:L-threonylcarbamoyladenylate synthase
MLVSFAQLIATALSGNPVSFPTDTVPALAVRPEAAAKLYQIKQRDATKPLILMAADSDELWKFATGDLQAQQIWQAMADRYWPGAVTFVLPASDRVLPGLNLTNRSTIGLRVPGSDIARDVLRATGPLATSSANLSGQSALVTTAEIDQHFPQVAVLDLPNPVYNSSPSTVIEWQDGHWQLLRAGAIKIPELS